MGQILIRNLPDDIIATYKEKARLAGTSLERYVRDLIEANAPFTSEEALALSQKFLDKSGGPHRSLTKDDIREGLE